jgi:DNA polymerase III delta prime subunit
MAVQFKKAVKYETKGRVALVGPAGSGKSLTGLKLARHLVGPEGKIAAVDTEHGSLSKYADLEEFDVIELDSYTADNFFAALKAAEDGGYGAFLCDSLSHFWMGKDGTLEFVDEKKKSARGRGADQMDGWKEWSPTERRMIDAILASKCHVIVTMRTKTEYKDEEYTKRDGSKGTKRVKIGLMPVQRQGLEYEFDLIGYMTDENDFVTDKTRCPHYAGRAITKPSGKDFEPFRAWLAGEKQSAAWAPKFAELEQQIGPQLYIELLGKQGYESASDIPNKDQALTTYRAVAAAAKARQESASAA